MADFNEQAEWNMAFQFLRRVDRLFDFVNYNRMTGNIAGWYQGLLNIYCEIHAYMKPDQKEVADEFETKLFEPMGIYMKKAIKGRGSCPPDLWKMLNEYHKHLKDAFKSTGLEMKFRDDPRFAR